MTLTYETARWADGPKFVAWLERKGVNPNHYGNLGRRATDWRKGGSVDFYTVDKLLCAAGLVLFEVDDDVWTDRAPNRAQKKAAATRIREGRSGRRLSPAEVLEIRREIGFGAKKVALARRYGVTRKTIFNIASGYTWAHLEDRAA